MKLLLILLTFLLPFKNHAAETIISLQLTKSNDYKLMIASSPLKNNIYTVENVPIVKIRTLLIQAAESKKANKELKTILDACNPKNPLINGYQGASVMIEAKHMFNPLARWNKFKQGKALIEDAIKADSLNYELRYLRFAIQTNIPPVLGYSADIQADKKLLIDRLRKITDTDLRNRVFNFLLSAKVCTKEELNKLKQWKNG
ncbi:hypothetical protein [Pedobacter immunditicola]|uniref:hypothetical protein n=1 Tax=Pedobacter immunditicola TaxID=3133440 RepID=UPI0030A931E5